MTREALEQKFDAVHARLPAECGAVRRRESRRCSKAGRKTPAGRTAFLQKHFAVLDGQAVIELLELTKNEDFDRVVAEHLKGKSLRYTWSFRTSLLARYAALHKKAELLAATKDYLAANPYTFSWRIPGQQPHRQRRPQPRGENGLAAEVLHQGGSQRADDRAVQADGRRQGLGGQAGVPGAAEGIRPGRGPPIRPCGPMPASRRPVPNSGPPIPARRPAPRRPSSSRSTRGPCRRTPMRPATWPRSRRRKSASCTAIASGTTDAARAAWAELWAPRVGRGAAVDRLSGNPGGTGERREGQSGPLQDRCPSYFALLGANDQADPAASGLVLPGELPQRRKADRAGRLLSPRWERRRPDSCARQMSNPKYNGPDLSRIGQARQCPGLRVQGPRLVERLHRLP